MVHLVGHHADRSRAQRQVASDRDRGADPAGGERAPNLAVRKQRDVSFQRAQPRDQPIGAVGHLLGRLAAGAAVGKNVPAGSRRANAATGKSFVVAVVPFLKIGVDFRCLRQSSQFAGAPSALPWTDEYPGEGDWLKPRPQRARFLLAARGQRQVGEAGMLPCERPRGLAVTDEIETKGLRHSRFLRDAAALLAIALFGRPAAGRERFRANLPGCASRPQFFLELRVRARQASDNLLRFARNRLFGARLFAGPDQRLVGLFVSHRLSLAHIAPQGEFGRVNDSRLRRRR
jgi:hypothetical protein